MNVSRNANVESEPSSRPYSSRTILFCICNNKEKKVLYMAFNIIRKKKSTWCNFFNDHHIKIFTFYIERNMQKKKIKIKAFLPNPIFFFNFFNTFILLLIGANMCVSLLLLLLLLFPPQLLLLLLLLLLFVR